MKRLGLAKANDLLARANGEIAGKEKVQRLQPWNWRKRRAF